METLLTDPTTSAAYVVLSFFLPLLVALVKQAGWSHQANSILALVVYVLVGAGAALLADIPLTVENIAPLAAVATVVGSAGYSLFWNAIGSGDGTMPSLDQRLTYTTSIVKGDAN